MAMSGGLGQEPAGGLEDGAVALPAPEQERSLSLMERPEPVVPPSWRERLLSPKNALQAIGSSN